MGARRLNRMGAHSMIRAEQRAARCTWSSIPRAEPRAGAEPVAGSGTATAASGGAPGTPSLPPSSVIAPPVRPKSPPPSEIPIRETGQALSALAGELGDRAAKRLAVISGAGPTGLAMALALKAQGYEYVVVADARPTFSRRNFVTLKRECFDTLTRLGVQDALVESSAELLREHRLYRMKGDGSFTIQAELAPRAVPDPNKAISARDFRENALMTVSISELQRVLNEEAVKRGVSVFKSARTSIECDEERPGHYTISVQHEGDRCRLPAPDLIIVAEGASSKVPEQLGIAEDRSPQLESWFIGNLGHAADRSYVGMIADTRETDREGAPVPDISNCIANSEVGEINVAIRFRPGTRLSDEQTRRLLQRSARLVLEDREAPPSIEPEGSPEVRWVLPAAVEVKNRKLREFTKGKNLIFAGDASGSGSPLAGLGASLGTSAYVRLVEDLVQDLDHARAAGSSASESLRRYAEGVSSYVDLWHESAARNEEALFGARRLQTGRLLRGDPPGHRHARPAR